jgi:hypothetical protein
MTSKSDQKSSEQHRAVVEPDLDAAPTPPVVGDRRYGIMNTDRFPPIFTNKQTGLEQSTVGPDPAIVQDIEELRLQLGRQQHAFGIDHLGPVTMDFLAYDTSGSNGTFSDVQHVPTEAIQALLRMRLSNTHSEYAADALADAQHVYAAYVAANEPDDVDGLKDCREERAEIFRECVNGYGDPFRSSDYDSPDELFDAVEEDLAEVGLIDYRPTRDKQYVQQWPEQ